MITASPCSQFRGERTECIRLDTRRRWGSRPGDNHIWQVVTAVPRKLLADKAHVFDQRCSRLSNVEAVKTRVQQSLVSNELGTVPGQHAVLLALLQVKTQIAMQVRQQCQPWRLLPDISTGHGTVDYCIADADWDSLRYDVLQAGREPLP